MWTSLLVLVAVAWLAIWISTSSLLVANLCMLPFLGPFICGPIFASPFKGGPLRLLFFSLFVYALFTTFVKMWPAECRRMWRQHLSYDNGWNVSTALQALEKEESQFAPGASKGEFDTWVHNVEVAQGVNRTASARPMTGEFLRLNRRLDEVDPAFALPAARSLDGIAIAPAVDPAAVTTIPPATAAAANPAQGQVPVILEGAVTTATPVDDILPRPALVKDRELVLYCDFHNKDPRETWPKFHIWKFEGECDPTWTCTFTQQRDSGTWQFWLALLGGVLLNSLYTCLDQDFLEYWCGAGQCRLWWCWFWAGLIPLWGVSFVTKIKGVNNGTFMEWLWKTATVIIDDAQAMIIIGSVSFVALLLIVNREVIYRTLGIDDRKLLHWINADRVTSSKKRRIFQVCVWRVDLDSQESDHDYTDFRAGAEGGQVKADEGGYGGPSARAAVLPQGVDGPETQGLLGGLLGAGIRAPQPQPQQGGTTLNALRNAAGNGFFGSSSPMKGSENRLQVNDDGNVNLFIRLAYGDNEPQTTCVQRITSSLDHQGVIYFQETFRLNFDGSSLPLNVQVCDQQLVGYKRLGACHFTTDMLEENFRWSRKRERVLQNRVQDSGFSDPIAGEQVVVMMQAANHGSQRKGTWQKSEEGRETRYRMMNVGFRPYVLNEGGSVWLSFAEIGGTSEGGVISSLAGSLSSWWS